MTVACDWDGTLVDARTQEWLPGALEALRSLCRGSRVVIHTCRANWPEGLAGIEAKLAEAGVTVDGIVAKPRADFYVDNQAVPFLGDWARTLALLELARSGGKQPEPKLPITNRILGGQRANRVPHHHTDSVWRIIR